MSASGPIPCEQCSRAGWEPQTTAKPDCFECKGTGYKQPLRREVRNTRPIDGYEVYHSAEFKALCVLLGIEWEWPTKTVKLEFTLAEGSDVVVTQTYLAMTAK